MSDRELAAQELAESCRGMIALLETEPWPLTKSGSELAKRLGKLLGEMIALLETEPWALGEIGTQLLGSLRAAIADWEAAERET